MSDADGTPRRAALGGARNIFLNAEGDSALARGHSGKGGVWSADLVLLAVRAVDESIRGFAREGWAAEPPLEVAERHLSQGSMWITGTSLSRKSELGARHDGGPSGLADSPAFTAALSAACQAACAALRREGEHGTADFMHEAARDARAEVARQFAKYLAASEDAKRIMYHVTESGVAESSLFAMSLRSAVERVADGNEPVPLDTLRGTGEAHSVANRTATPQAFEAAERVASVLESLEGFGPASMREVVAVYQAAMESLPDAGKLSTTITLSADGVIEAFETCSNAILAEVADFVRDEISKAKLNRDKMSSPAREPLMAQARTVKSLLIGAAARPGESNVIAFKPRER